MSQSETRDKKAALSESLLESISEVMSSIATVDVEQDLKSFTELQTAQNTPTNETQVLESLSAKINRAKDLVARCNVVAQALMDDELQSITQDLENVIKNTGEDLSRIAAAAAFGSNWSFSQEMRDSHLQVVGNRQHPYQPPYEGYSNGQPRRRTLHNSDMPRLVDFLQGMYHESHEFGGQSFSSLPEVAEYVEPLYDAFFCPLTSKVMVDPVTIDSGMTYERTAIEEHFDKSTTDGSEPVTCPVTKMPLQSKTLRNNVSLKNTIAEWMMRNEATRVRIARTALSMATTEGMLLEAIHELKLLAKLRRKNREQMHKIGITKFLARLLQNKDAQIRCDALELLCLLVEDEGGKEIIGKTRAIARTIKLLSSNTPEERHAAISFLLELSRSELLLENIGSAAGSILILTTMKFNDSDDPIAAAKAGEILKNLEKCPKNIKYMAESGYLDPLQSHLVEGSEEIQMEMVSYLSELVLKQEMTIDIAGSTSEILIKMVHNGNTMIRKAAFDILVQISSHRPNSKTLVDAGVVPIMIEELFIRKIDDEPMGSKEEAAAVLANIVESGLDPESIQVNKEGHTITSKYSIYNFAHMLKCSMPDKLNLSLLRVLLSLTRLAKPLATVVSVTKENEGSHTVIEFLNSPMEELNVAATRLLITLSPHMGHTIAERLCKTQGQPGRLVKSIDVPGRITERHAVSVTLLSKLPYQNITLNLALLHQGTIPTILSRIEEVQRGETRTCRHAKPYVEGLVGALVRFTTTLYDPEVLMAAMKHNFTSVLTELLVRAAGSDEVQRLAAVGLENLSYQSVNLSRPPEERRPKKKNILSKMLNRGKDAAGRLHNNKNQRSHICPVHRGMCTSATTFCLLEAGAVEGLLGCLENENGRVVEAALGALCTLVDDRVDVESSVSVLAEFDAVKYVLKVLRQHREDVLWQKCFWVIERFLLKGSERCVRDISSDRMLPTALVTAFHKGDVSTKQVAESILTSLHKMPDYSANYVSMEF